MPSVFSFGQAIEAQQDFRAGELPDFSPRLGTSAIELQLKSNRNEDLETTQTSVEGGRAQSDRTFRMFNSRIRRCSMILLCMAAFAVLILGHESQAGLFRRSPSTQTRPHTGYAHPAGGYGSNLHRNFVLRREMQRQRQGLPVRQHGNIMWLRSTN